MKKLELIVEASGTHLESPRLDWIRFRIVNQTHRGSTFGENLCHEFIASNGIKLASQNDPEWLEEYQRLWTRGSNSEKDMRSINVDRITWERINVAVKEYNEYFADRHLRLRGYINRKKNRVRIEILIQTHRCYEFTKENDHHFNASNNIVLASFFMPAWQGDNCLCLRGETKLHDNAEIITNCFDWERIKAAVREYNETIEIVE